MANPAPTINQINAFNATQGTTIDFNIIGGTELVRSNRIYIYDLSDNSLICTHLYVSTESIHELPPNTDGSIVYESGKSSADFVNGAQYYAQIQTFTDIAGTEGGSGLSVAKMFWCLVDPTLTITTIPSTISTTSYNVSATYNANTSVVSNIIQQYQFSLYSATGSLLQSSGVVVGSGTQQGTSTAYDISYNFTGLSVGSSYYVVVDVTTTQGTSVNAQSNTFTVSIDTPTLGEATVVNNACDGYISVTSNLSSEYGGSGSGEIVSFETDSENVFTKLQVDLEPVQDLNGYDAPWVGGAGKNKMPPIIGGTKNGITATVNGDGSVTLSGTATGASIFWGEPFILKAGTYIITGGLGDQKSAVYLEGVSGSATPNTRLTIASDTETKSTIQVYNGSTVNYTLYPMLRLASESDATYAPYENICPISGHDEVEVGVASTYADMRTLTGDGYVRGSFLASDGSYVTNAGFNITQYVPVNGGDSCYLGIGIYTNPSICFYDENKNFISGEKYNGRAPLTTTAPNGSAYLRCSFENMETMLIVGKQSYAQEIEATYTPTVQENEPYQFKATGDVGGDRESIELVGGSVAWNQLANTDTNNFHDHGSASTSVTSGEIKISSTSNDVTFKGRVINLTEGHVYLGGCAAKSDGTSNIGCGFRSENGASITIGVSTLWSFPITYERQFRMAKATANTDMFGIMLKNDTPSGNYGLFKDVILVDLTQYFSSSTIADYVYSLEQATAGSGIAWLRKYYPKLFTSNPYDAGTIKSVEGVSEHVTVGFNQWDEEWELGYLGYSPSNEGQPITSNNTIRSKNYIPVVPNTSYYFKYPIAEAHYVWEYDANKTALRHYQLTANGSNNPFTTPSDCYFIKFACESAYGTTYNHDICINISDTTKNGTYEPYVKNTYPLDSSITLRGLPKIANGKLYYDGDTYRSDGLHSERYGVKTYDGSTGAWDVYNGVFYAGFSGYKKTPNEHGITALGNSLVFVGQNTGASYLVDKGRGTFGFRSDTNMVQIYPPDSSITTSAQFNAYLAQHPLTFIYEKESTTTSYAQPFENIQKVTPNYGTEEFVTTSIVPVGNNTQYYTRDIYGGYIDLVSGELVVTHGLIDLGTRTYSKESESVFYADLTSLSIKSQPNTAIASDVISSSYATKSVNSIQTSKSGVGYYTYSGNGHTYLYIGDSRYSTGADLKQALNGVQLVYPLAAPITYQLTPQQIQTLVGVNNVWSEQGNIELSYHIPITNLLVKRQDVADVSGDWLTLYSQPITQASDMDFTFIDFTNQYGKTYKYALVPLLTQTQSGVEVEVEGGYTVSDEVQSVFDGVFIADSTGSQKCKANVGYGNVDMNQAVGTITPIGAKYPVVITNSQNQYHNGSISGTIVPDDYYFNGNLSRIDMVNKRDELEQFLTNKRAKIIKDWNGKIWLVMIMDNVSCTFNNNYGMGIVNFSTNWVEVGDPTNQEDLQATGLINIGGV